MCNACGIRWRRKHYAIEKRRRPGPRPPVSPSAKWATLSSQLSHSPGGPHRVIGRTGCQPPALKKLSPISHRPALSRWSQSTGSVTSSYESHQSHSRAAPNSVANYSKDRLSVTTLLTQSSSHAGNSQAQTNRVTSPLSIRNLLNDDSTSTATCTDHTEPPRQVYENVPQQLISSGYYVS